MRIVIYIVLVGFALGFMDVSTSKSTVNAELDKSAIKKAVGKYVDAEATADTKEKYQRILLRGKNADVAKALKSALKKEDKLENALDLAIALQLRGLFKTAKSKISVSPKKIVKLGLITNDKGAVKDLIKIWEESDTDSEVYDAILQGLKSIGVDIGDLNTFYKLTDDSEADEARRVAAGQILAFQGGLDTEDPDEIALLWDGIAKKYKVDGKSTESTGLSLRHIDDIREHNLKVIGRNIQISSAGSIYCTWPDHFGDGDYTVTIYFKVSADFVGKIGTFHYRDKVPSILGLICLDRRIKIISGKGEVFEKISPGKWISASFSFSKGKINGSDVYKATTTCGKLEMDGTHTKNRQLGFAFHCSEGSGVLANVDYVQTK